jgi:hypothetical protein
VEKKLFKNLFIYVLVLSVSAFIFLFFGYGLIRETKRIETNPRIGFFIFALVVFCVNLTSLILLIKKSVFAIRLLSLFYLCFSATFLIVSLNKVFRSQSLQIYNSLIPVLLLIILPLLMLFLINKFKFINQSYQEIDDIGKNQK